MKAASSFALICAVLVTLGLASGASSRPTKSIGCTHWAAPGGNDAGLGSEPAPYGTVAHLLLTLRPGQRGCLAPGAVFSEHVVVSVSGRVGAPIILESTPNRQGSVLQGGVEFAPAVHDVLIEHVAVRTTATTQLPALVVLRGLRNGLIDSNVQGAAASPASEACIMLDHANRAVVDHNAIERCGQLPNAQGYVPGVLDSVSTGAQITNNVIRQNPSDGIALAPDAQLTFVSRNLIENNGGGIYFGGAAKFASSDNTVTHNAIARSATYNVHASYGSGAPLGKKNIVVDNCLWQGGQGNVAGMLPSGGGFKTSGNIVAAPTAKVCKLDLPSANLSTSPSATTTTKNVATRLISRSRLTLTAAAAITGNHVKLITLTVHGTIAGATVTLGCISGCGLTETLRAGGAGTASSKVFANQTLPRGAVIEVRTTKSGYVGAWGRFIVRPNVAAAVVFHIEATGCLHGTEKIACPKASK